MTDFSLIIPAAGLGARSAQSLPKQYVPILERPLLEWTLSTFIEIEACCQIIVAVDPEWRREAEKVITGFVKVVLVDGGKERQDSIRNGLSRIKDELSIVLIHDAVRPVVSPELIGRLIEAVAEHGAAIPVLPIAETVKRVRAEQVLKTLPRDELYTAQTPQGFDANLLRRAYEHAMKKGVQGTDDASLVEALGERVAAIPGESDNIKVTWPVDFERVEWLLRSQQATSKSAE